MRLKLVSTLALLTTICFLSIGQLHAQNFSFNCTRDTLIPGCSPTPCFTLRAIVPDLKASSATYTVNPISSNLTACAPVYSSPAIVGTSTNLTSDDVYSNIIPIGFAFPFYGALQNSLVVSTNGAISFDLTLANQFAHYGIMNQGGLLTNGPGGTAENLPSNLYDPALIMGPYQDVDITIGSSVNRRIQYTTVGTAPNRKWIISFFQIPLFSFTGVCDPNYRNTSQIILNEATGIIEVIIFSKQQCPQWNNGRAMVGIQDFTRTNALMAPGRRASDAPWGTINMNESWRFVPSSGASLFKRVELYDNNGVLIPGATPTVNVLPDGTREVLIPNLCPPAGVTTTYVLKSVYEKYDNAAVEIAGFDTIRVVRSAAADLSATATSTVSACGVNGTGSVTVAVPAGVGVAPFQYSLTSAAGPFQASNVFTNVAAGNYTAYVRDNGGCSSAIPITVTSTGVMGVTFTTTNTSCPGASNGTVTVNANGTPTIEYRINMGPWVTTNVFTGLGAGTYFFDIRDATGCHADLQPATVSNGTGTVTGTATPTATSCVGVNNGAITIVPTSGVGPYQYSLNGTTWQASATFNGLAPGNYNAFVREGGVCISAAIPVNVIAGNGLAVNITATGTTCAGVNNGTVTVTPTTGTGPFTVTVGAIVRTAPSPIVVTGVAAGTHTVTITDAGGCAASGILTATVVAGTGFTATHVITATSCNGASDGSIAVTPQAPGTSPYSFTLTPGGVTQTGATNTTFTGLANGTYSILVTDANGCQYTLSNQLVPQGPGLQATITNTATTCAGVNNGTVSVTPSSGTGPYTFVLDGTTTQTGAITTVFNGLTAGAHSVTITDVNGCRLVAPLTTTITNGNGYTATAVTTSTSCNGVNDGTITISPQAPGVAPFTYVLTPGAVSQTTAVFTGRAAGTYSVLVRDVNGCEFTVNNILVAQGAGLNAILTPTSTSCTGVNNGSISVTSNGTAPFTFVLDGTVTQNSPTNTTVFNNLAPGNHSLTVTDANGCTTGNAVSATIAVGNGFTASYTTTDVACAGEVNGTITATVTSGGTAPFTFIVDGSVIQTHVNPKAILLGISAGTPHTVIIRDALGCTKTFSNIVISEPPPLAAVPVVQQAKCNGADGSITINASGGTAPYDYALNGPNYQTSNTFSLGAGTYLVVVRDARRCDFRLNITITEPSALNATVASTSNASCNGGADGGIVIQATGGTAPYQYALDGGQFQSSSTLAAIAGPHSVVVKDANDCVFTIPNVVVGLTNNLVLTPLVDPAPICEGTNVALQVTSNAASYAWSPTTDINNAVSPNPTFSPSTTQIYTVVATLGACTATDDVLIRVLPAPVADPGPSGVICYGQSYQLHGAGGGDYTWTPSTNLNNTGISDPEVVSPVRTMVYSLVVTDANNCKSLNNAQATVQVTPPIKITLSPVDTVVYAGAQFHITATSPATSYSWLPANYLDDPSSASPLVTAPGSPDHIDFQVIGLTDAGCRGEAYATVKIYKGPDIYVPNAFSPNNDGKNELFMPFPVGVKKLNYFSVFNRQGQLLFTTSAMNKGWDGKLAGTDQGTGVYVWMVQGVTDDGKIINKKGHVTLVR